MGSREHPNVRDQVQVWAVRPQEDHVRFRLADCGARGLSLVATKVVQDDDISEVQLGFRVGSSAFSTQVWNISALIGPSNTQGAPVTVRGTGDQAGACLAAPQPLKGAMLVFTQVPVLGPLVRQ